MISVLIFILIEIQLVCKADAIELRSPVPIGSIEHGKSNTVGHAHRPDTGSITTVCRDGISGHILHLRFLVVAILVAGLIGGDFF
jgi:hypothetical protein